MNFPFESLPDFFGPSRPAPLPWARRGKHAGGHVKQGRTKHARRERKRHYPGSRQGSRP